MGLRRKNALVVFSRPEKKIISSLANLLYESLSDRHKVILNYVLLERHQSITALINKIAFEKKWAKSTIWYNLRKLQSFGLVFSSGKVGLTDLGKCLIKEGAR
ncbi:MAG: hypothetical protein Q8Q31_03730 [Nanoarchaeota archaeon]|nr:hypothetical protein [Nanoarchaeota archaeon]